MTNDLKPKQEKFCQEYVSDPKRNATQAAIRAGYSSKAARCIASENMTKPYINQRIKELEREALEAAGYSIEALKPIIMRQLVNQATTDISEIAQVIYADDERRKATLEQMAESNGGQTLIDFGQPLIYIKPTSEWTPEQRAAVKAIEPSKEGIKIIPHDKLAALRLLTDITGLSKQSIELSGAGGQALSLNLVFGDRDAHEHDEGHDHENDEDMNGGAEMTDE